MPLRMQEQMIVKGPAEQVVVTEPARALTPNLSQVSRATDGRTLTVQVPTATQSGIVTRAQVEQVQQPALRPQAPVQQPTVERIRQPDGTVIYQNGGRVVSEARPVQEAAQQATTEQVLQPSRVFQLSPFKPPAESSQDVAVSGAVSQGVQEVLAPGVSTPGPDAPGVSTPGPDVPAGFVDTSCPAGYAFDPFSASCKLIVASEFIDPSGTAPADQPPYSPPAKDEGVDKPNYLLWGGVVLAGAALLWYLSRSE